MSNRLDNDDWSWILSLGLCFLANTSRTAAFIAFVRENISRGVCSSVKSSIIKNCHLDVVSIWFSQEISCRSASCVTSSDNLAAFLKLEGHTKEVRLCATQQFIGGPSVSKVAAASPQSCHLYNTGSFASVRLLSVTYTALFYASLSDSPV